MTDHGDQLREAFENHENLAPDPAVVYDRVQELARTYRWRRRGAQVAGGAVLSAGLIAGGIALPGILPAAQNDNVAQFAPGAATTTSAAPLRTPVPTRSPSEEELQKDWDAYFGAGYGYDDALKLAKIWHLKGDVGLVKAEAGRRLLAGQTLPIKPGPESPGTGTGTSTKEERQVAAFFAAGYDYNDAVKLAKIWHTVDPYHAKIKGGKKILAGQTLPIRP